MATPTAEAAPGVATALQTAADALHATARQHKALERQHRRQAQAAMRERDRLLAACAAIGIRLVTAQEAETHGPDRT